MFLRILFGLLISGAVLAQDKPPPGGGPPPGGVGDPCKEDILEYADDKECHVKAFVELMASMLNFERVDVGTHSAIQVTPLTAISSR